MVGKPCTSLGLVMGDGPGRSIVCVKKGKKKMWLPLAANKRDPSPMTSSGVTDSGSSTSSACSQLPVFTADFIDPSYVRVVTPIGGQTGSGGVIAVRSYVHPSNDFMGKELPVFAPVDMTFYQASYYKVPGSPDSYQPEYALYFEVGCGISVKFFHIKGVVGNVAEVAPKVQSPSSAGQDVKKTAIKAGEQIGWYKLGENSVAFDFWVDNAARTNDFIVASHFASSNALHSVCPYDFYPPAKRAQWFGKLGAPGGIPVPGTSCGVVTEGKTGTADGMWFVGTDTMTDHLAYEGAYQSQIMLSTDTDMNVRIGGLNTSASLTQMFVGPQMSTWRKPSDVLVGETQCWSDDKQSVRVKVMSTTTMSVNVGLGPCTALPDVCTDKIYYR